MHQSVMTWVAAKVAEHDLASTETLEVGSLNVNGSVRGFFHGPFVGVDMQNGPGVDRVASAADLPFGDASFGVVITTEMLEHDTRPWKSFAEMARVLRPGGFFVATARGYDNRGCFPVHDYPGDYWRYSVSGFHVLLDDSGLAAIEVVEDPEAPGVFAIARKR